MALSITDIKEIKKNPNGKGYLIVFNDNREISIHKRRTIPALLTLIRHGEGCENDLTSSTNNLKEIKEVLGDKIPSNLIQDSYSDANKPFSELWNEEGFVFIQNPVGLTRQGSQAYVLLEEDHDKLFSVSKKAERKPPTAVEQVELLNSQNSKCNFCGTTVMAASKIAANTFAKDRVRLVWDHRRPVEKDGTSDKGNYQGLCFYCNKCKWQICNICTSNGDHCANCALAFPEKTSVIYPTKEDIADRMNRSNP